MAEVIGVRFKESGKVYYFAPDKPALGGSGGEQPAAIGRIAAAGGSPARNNTVIGRIAGPGQAAAGARLQKGDMVIVETARGMECGEVAMENRMVPDNSIVQPLRKMLRKATKEDLHRVEENRKKEQAAFVACEKKIAERKLDMKLVDVEYTFDNSKVLFYFTADGRVDFRELVKDLAGLFRTRIELRQIGVRDEAKMLGGIGICGRPFCCGSFLGGFQPVSIKMAKEQGLSLNPVKISGTCGRLMCCLKYEQEAYLDLLHTTPKVNAVVSTPEGKGVVIDQNLLTGKLTVRLDKDQDAAPKVFKVSEVKLLRDGKIKVDQKELEHLKKLEET